MSNRVRATPGLHSSTRRPGQQRSTNSISASLGKDSLTRIRSRSAGSARAIGHQDRQNRPIGSCDRARVATAAGNSPPLETKFTPHLHRRVELRCAALAEVALNFLSFSPRRPSGEFRVAIEAALEAFGRLSVGDPDASNGVLMCVLLADRDVEIVADRRCNGRVSSEEWASVCRAMESSFRGGQLTREALAGIARVSDLVEAHFPVARGSANSDELPNRPTIL
jgi:hypothetical protein